MNNQPANNQNGSNNLTQNQNSQLSTEDLFQIYLQSIAELEQKRQADIQTYKSIYELPEQQKILEQNNTYNQESLHNKTYKTLQNATKVSDKLQFFANFPQSLLVKNISQSPELLMLSQMGSMYLQRYLSNFVYRTYKNKENEIITEYSKPFIADTVDKLLKLAADTSVQGTNTLFSSQTLHDIYTPILKNLGAFYFGSLMPVLSSHLYTMSNLSQSIELYQRRNKTKLDYLDNILNQTLSLGYRAAALPKFYSLLTGELGLGRLSGMLYNAGSSVSSNWYSNIVETTKFAQTHIPGLNFVYENILLPLHQFYAGLLGNLPSIFQYMLPQLSGFLSQTVQNIIPHATMSTFLSQAIPLLGTNLLSQSGTILLPLYLLRTAIRLFKNISTTGVKPPKFIDAFQLSQQLSGAKYLNPYITLILQDKEAATKVSPLEPYILQVLTLIEQHTAIIPAIYSLLQNKLELSRYGQELGNDKYTKDFEYYDQKEEGFTKILSSMSRFLTKVSTLSNPLTLLMYRLKGYKISDILKMIDLDRIHKEQIEQYKQTYGINTKTVQLLNINPNDLIKNIPSYEGKLITLLSILVDINREQLRELVTIRHGLGIQKQIDVSLEKVEPTGAFSKRIAEMFSKSIEVLGSGLRKITKAEKWSKYLEPVEKIFDKVSNNTFLAPLLPFLAVSNPFLFGSLYLTGVISGREKFKKIFTFSNYTYKTPTTEETELIQPMLQLDYLPKIYEVLIDINNSIKDLIKLELTQEKHNLVYTMIPISPQMISTNINQVTDNKLNADIQQYKEIIRGERKNILPITDSARRIKEIIKNNKEEHEYTERLQQKAYYDEQQTKQIVLTFNNLLSKIEELKRTKDLKQPEAGKLITATTKNIGAVSLDLLLQILGATSLPLLTKISPEILPTLISNPELIQTIFTYTSPTKTLLEGNVKNYIKEKSVDDKITQTISKVKTFKRKVQRIIDNIQNEYKKELIKAYRITSKIHEEKDLSKKHAKIMALYNTIENLFRQYTKSFYARTEISIPQPKFNKYIEHIKDEYSKGYKPIKDLFSVIKTKYQKNLQYLTNELKYGEKEAKFDSFISTMLDLIFEPTIGFTHKFITDRETREKTIAYIEDKIKSFISRALKHRKYEFVILKDFKKDLILTPPTSQYEQLIKEAKFTKKDLQSLKKAYKDLKYTAIVSLQEPLLFVKQKEESAKELNTTVNNVADTEDLIPELPSVNKQHIQTLVAQTISKISNQQTSQPQTVIETDKQTTNIFAIIIDYLHELVDCLCKSKVHEQTNDIQNLTQENILQNLLAINTDNILTVKERKLVRQRQEEYNAITETAQNTEKLEEYFTQGQFKEDISQIIKKALIDKYLSEYFNNDTSITQEEKSEDSGHDVNIDIEKEKSVRKSRKSKILDSIKRIGKKAGTLLMAGARALPSVGLRLLSFGARMLPYVGPILLAGTAIYGAYKIGSWIYHKIKGTNTIDTTIDILKTLDFKKQQELLQEHTKDLDKKKRKEVLNTYEVFKTYLLKFISQKDTQQLITKYDTLKSLIQQTENEKVKDKLIKRLQTLKNTIIDKFKQYVGDRIYQKYFARVNKEQLFNLIYNYTEKLLKYKQIQEDYKKQQEKLKELKKKYEKLSFFTSPAEKLKLKWQIHEVESQIEKDKEVLDTDKEFIKEVEKTVKLKTEQETEKQKTLAKEISENITTVETKQKDKQEETKPIQPIIINNTTQQNKQLESETTSLHEKILNQLFDHSLAFLTNGSILYTGIEY